MRIGKPEKKATVETIRVPIGQMGGVFTHEGKRWLADNLAGSGEAYHVNGFLIIDFDDAEDAKLAADYFGHESK